MPFFLDLFQTFPDSAEDGSRKAAALSWMILIDPRTGVMRSESGQHYRLPGW
ncbi:MAG: hypothetical protein HYR60_05535 [Acidobacteria bacterium]|nr:hypothetical protein [Acidobacteriota bacterium]